MCACAPSERDFFKVRAAVGTPHTAVRFFRSMNLDPVHNIIYKVMTMTGTHLYIMVLVVDSLSLSLSIDKYKGS